MIKILHFIVFYLLFAMPLYAQELRDVKSPVEYPANYVWLYILVGIILIGLVTAGIYFWKKKNIKLIPDPEPKKPWEIAHEQLEALIQKDYLKSGEFNSFYVTLADILRLYIENQFSIRAPEMTTEEFIISLNSAKEITEDQKKVLKGFLEYSDMVKFAKFKPNIEEAEKGFNSAKQFITETTNHGV